MMLCHAGWWLPGPVGAFIHSKKLSLPGQPHSPLHIWHGWLGLKQHVSLILPFSLPRERSKLRLRFPPSPELPTQWNPAAEMASPACACIPSSGPVPN